MAFKLFFQKNNREKGAVAVLLTLLITGVTLLIAMGLSQIFISEMKSSRLVAYSGPAFYAADAGAEYALFQVIKKSAAPQSGVPLSLSYGATALVSWTNTSVNSTGFFSGTRREVEINW